MSFRIQDITRNLLSAIDKRTEEKREIQNRIREEIENKVNPEQELTSKRNRATVTPLFHDQQR